MQRRDDVQPRRLPGCEFPEMKSGIPLIMGYVRSHSAQEKAFSLERSGCLHLGQAKPIGFIGVELATYFLPRVYL